VLFGFLTGHTQKIGFAVGVLILAQRQTVLVAKQSASLDILCGGRFRLGIGVGWNEIEFSATLWRLKFPRYGDDHSGCEWIAVLAQGVPAHVGRSSRGPGHVEEDPYYTFLPPAGTCPTDDDGQPMRAVVFVTEATPKGTARSPQEYVRPSSYSLDMSTPRSHSASCIG
jgi:Luciferase-like monooxygenase